MIDIIIDDGVGAGRGMAGVLPAEEQIRKAVQTACIETGFTDKPSLCIRFADDATVAALNSRWRNREAVTDILSFPMQAGPDFDPAESLGDMILAVPFTIKESARLSLPVAAHMLHLIIHATLHLLGYDHIDDEDAKMMHKHERAAMQRLGLHDPYPEDEGENNA